MKISTFCPFRLVQKRSFNLLCVLEQFTKPNQCSSLCPQTRNIVNIWINFCVHHAKNSFLTTYMFMTLNSVFWKKKPEDRVLDQSGMMLDICGSRAALPKKCLYVPVEKISSRSSCIHLSEATMQLSMAEPVSPRRFKPCRKLAL